MATRRNAKASSDSGGQHPELVASTSADSGGRHSTTVAAETAADPEAALAEAERRAQTAEQRLQEVEQRYAALTEQVQADSRGRTAQLHAILDALPDAIYINRGDGDELQMNAAAREQLAKLVGPGVPLTADALAAYLAARDAQGHIMAPEEWPFARSLRGEVLDPPHAVDLVVPTSDGGELHTSVTGAPLRDAEGNITGAVHVVRDVTEQRRLQRELERRANLLEATFEAMTDGVIVYDRNGKMLRTNAANRAILGNEAAWHDYFSRPIEERLPLLDMRDARNRPLPRKQWPHMRILRGEVLTGETAVDVYARDLSGQYKHLTITGAPLRDAAGQIVGAVCIHRDVSEQRRLERHVRESASESIAWAAQLEAIFNAIADGIYVYDRDGHLTQTNAAARQLNPLTAQTEYLEHAFGERIAPFSVRDEHGQPLPLDEIPVMRVLRGEVLTGTNATNTIMRLPDGHDILLNTTGAPVRNEEGNVTGAVIVTRDVTDRWRLEQRTRDALAALLAMAQTLVRAPEVASEDAERVVAHRLAVLACSVLGCRRVAIQAVEPETHLLWPVAVVGLNPEQERQWWEAQHKAHMHLGDGVAAAESARFLAGETITLDLTQPPYDTIPNPYGITTMMVAPMQTGGQVVGILSLDYSGERHQYTHEERLLAEAVAQLAAIVVERERLQRERAKAEARALALQETNQLMNEFLGIAGHELRTPMTSAKANVQLAEHLLRRLLNASEGGQDVPGTLQRMHTLVTRTERQMRRQERLVNDLLDVSRIQAGRLEIELRAVDLLAVVRDAVEEQRALNADRLITLEGPDGDAPVPVLVDPDRVGQVVTNYLVNALKYSPPEAPVVVSVQREADTATVSVGDEGQGLPPDEHPRIWEAFHQAPGIAVMSGSGIGLGLGLHISRTIVERHGGSVALESAPGAGSTFSFTLPLGKEA